MSGGRRVETQIDEGAEKVLLWLSPGLEHERLKWAEKKTRSA